MKPVMLAATFILIATFSVYPSLSAAYEEDTPISLAADMELTSVQQSALADEAVRGSPEAARRLASYNLIVRGDRDQSIKWYTIGAENGDSGCAFGLYSLMRGSDSDEDRKRATFWLHKAADGGLGYAKDELKALEKPSAKTNERI